MIIIRLIKNIHLKNKQILKGQLMDKVNSSIIMMRERKKISIINRVSKRTFVNVILEFLQKDIHFYYFLQPTIEVLRLGGFLPVTWNKTTKSLSYSFIWAIYGIFWIVLKIFSAFYILPKFNVKGFEVSNKL